MKADFDIAIVGSGFGGSLMALIARRLGRSVILLERGAHPRFAIGESSTPLANLLLEELARRYDLPRLLPLTKWGSWQSTYPEVACGLKRGFTFYHHRWNERWTSQPDRANELLVAASPHDEIADTHWYRPDFDHFLVREAQAAGAEYVDNVQLACAERNAGGIVLSGSSAGRAISIRSRFVVDATGPRGFLHRALNLGERELEWLPKTEALYSHFTGVNRWEDMHSFAEAPPYPADDAALHHVFDGGWIWVLRFNNGITSAGVAARSDVARELGFADGGSAWKRLLDRLPSVREQFADSKAALPFVHAPKLSFRSSRIAGDNWALLPSAAGFVDPLLSTGFPLTLLGITRLAAILERAWNSPRFAKRLVAYEAQTTNELLTAERLVAALYASMSNFPNFVSASLLYFAAASFCEAARRAGRPELPGESFLAVDHPSFGPRLRDCVESISTRAPNASQRLRQNVLDAIEPIDVAGLSNVTGRNWYPARAQDALNAAHKLGVDPHVIAESLKRAGWPLP